MCHGHLNIKLKYFLRFLTFKKTKRYIKILILESFLTHTTTHL